MITYNDLYEALRKERYSEELQVLPKNFLKDVAEYFEEKKKAGEKVDVVFSDISLKNKKKLENAMALFKELLLRRKRKILNLAFVASETGISKKDFENLLSSEKELFEEIVKSLERSEKNLNSAMSGEDIESKYQLVRFLQPVEEFLDLEGETLGPFEKGEVANIDKEIIEILLQGNKVALIEED